jgi:hypothetical protein
MDGTEENEGDRDRSVAARQPSKLGGVPHGSSGGDRVAFASAFIALCALGLSVYEGHANRLHQRLSVQPYVSFGFYYDSDSAHYALNNWGLGPATIRWFRATVDGKAQTSWRSVLRAIGLGPNVQFKQSIPEPGVMMPPSSVSQSVDILSVTGSAEKEALIVGNKRVQLEACYCSLYDECWLASTRTDRPTPRKSCEPAPAETFRWER